MESRKSIVVNASREREKERAARASLRFVHDGDVVGLGSGTTATYAVKLLADLLQDGFHVRGIPTSEQTRTLAASLGIPITAFDVVNSVDVTIDGADEVDPQLRLIKGRGGALLHEKIVASASRRLIIVVDSTKLVSALGAAALPVEVVEFAEPVVAARIEALGASVQRRQSDGAAYMTDEGHHILDCSFGQIADPDALARTLSEIPGVVGHGLFIDMADIILVGREDRVDELRRARS
jgi:ribose 5-phosphate isomerase A